MTPLIKMSEVDFFTQMTPFSAILPGRPCCSFWALNDGLKMPKNRYFCSPVALLRLQNVFSMLLDHKDALQLWFCLPGRLKNKADRFVLKESFKAYFEGFLRLKRAFCKESALKYDQNSLIASLKWAKNAFFGMPDL